MVRQATAATPTSARPETRNVALGVPSTRVSTPPSSAPTGIAPHTTVRHAPSTRPSSSPGTRVCRVVASMTFTATRAAANTPNSDAESTGWFTSPMATNAAAAVRIPPTRTGRAPIRSSSRVVTAAPASPPSPPTKPNTPNAASLRSRSSSAYSTSCAWASSVTRLTRPATVTSRSISGLPRSQRIPSTRSARSRVRVAVTVPSVSPAVSAPSAAPVPGSVPSPPPDSARARGR